jgi:hypothetical protein
VVLEQHSNLQDKVMHHQHTQYSTLDGSDALASLYMSL